LMAATLAEPPEGSAKAVRMEIRQPGTAEGVPEDCADGPRTAPPRSPQTLSLEQPVAPGSNASRREQRIIVAPKLVSTEIAHPLGDDDPDILTHREEIDGEGLAEFGVHLARVLHHLPLDQVDV